MSAGAGGGRLWRWTVGQWQAIEAEAAAERAAWGSGRFDWRPLVCFVAVAVILTIQEYIGSRGFYGMHIEKPPPLSEYRTSDWELHSFTWWAGFRVGGYLFLPVLIILCLPGERLRDYHLSFKGLAKHAPMYVAMFALVLPLVWAASQLEAFQRTYPFYKLANRSTADLVQWELLYAAQFLALEFFYRGFMLKLCRAALGPHAIFAMLVPYCMIHYGKPMAESLGAIIAGLILGTLALRTRSIWFGVIIHMGVALTMDLFALSHCPDDGPCLRRR